MWNGSFCIVVSMQCCPLANMHILQWWLTLRLLSQEWMRQYGITKVVPHVKVNLPKQNGAGQTNGTESVEHPTIKAPGPRKVRYTSWCRSYISIRYVDRTGQSIMLTLIMYIKLSSYIFRKYHGIADLIIFCSGPLEYSHSHWCH